MDSNDAAEIFIKQWAVYRRVVDADYMSHRAFFELLHDLVSSRTEPFSFLDLASGDASCSMRSLMGTGVADYTAVDLSEQALKLAEKNISGLPCRTRTVTADFREFLNAPSRDWDVIFIGFSFHHLIGEEKVDFARRLRTALSPGGEWIFFEPILLGGESRDAYLTRWRMAFENDWKGFSDEEKAAIWQHVSSSDYPESPERFEQIALKADFAACELLYTDPDQFYAAFRCTL